jgi:hypothetical protein
MQRGKGQELKHLDSPEVGYTTFDTSSRPSKERGFFGYSQWFGFIFLGIGLVLLSDTVYSPLWLRQVGMLSTPTDISAKENSEALPSYTQSEAKAASLSCPTAQEESRLTTKYPVKCQAVEHAESLDPVRAEGACDHFFTQIDCLSGENKVSTACFQSQTAITPFFSLVPFVYLIGGQKCASSSLFVDMEDNFPEIVTCDGQKERHFFDHEATLFPGKVPFEKRQCEQFFQCQGGFKEKKPKEEWNVTDWRLNQMCAPEQTLLRADECLIDHPRAQMGIDATPYFPVEDLAPAKLQTFYGRFSDKIKLIVILRDPVDRLRSWFAHMGDESGETTFDNFARDLLAFFKKYTDEKNGNYTVLELCEQWSTGKPYHIALPAVCGGLYGQRFEKWTNTFSPDQLLVVRFSAYVEQPSTVLIAIAQHLGLLTPERQKELEKVNVASHNNTAAAWHPMKPKGFDSTMSNEVRALLQDFYEPRNVELREYLRRMVLQGMTVQESEQTPDKTTGKILQRGAPWPF